MYHHGPPEIVGPMKDDALQNSADSFDHEDARFMSFYDDRKRDSSAESESFSKRSDDDDGFPTIDELLAGRKRSRYSEPKSSHDLLSKRRKHKKGDFDRDAVIAFSPSDDEPGSSNNPIDVDSAGDGEPLENRDPEIQSSTEEESQRTVLQKPPSETLQQQPDATAGNICVFDSTDSNKNAESTSTSTSFRSLAGRSDEAFTDDHGRQCKVPDPPASQTSDGTRSLIINHEHDSGSASAADRSAPDNIRQYGILGHRWVNRELQLSVLQETWVPADVLERNYPNLVGGYKQNERIPALRKSPRLNQQLS